MHLNRLIRRLFKGMASGLAVLLLACVLPIPGFCAEFWQNRCGFFEYPFRASGNFSLDVTRIALSQTGRKGKDFGYSEPWCADFVSDCAALAGAGSVIPGHCNCDSLMDNILKAGGKPIHGIPKPGDLCFFDWNRDGFMDHVEIVFLVQNGTLHTVGGNNGSGSPEHTVVYRNSYRCSAPQIGWIIRPGYPDSVRTEQSTEREQPLSFRSSPLSPAPVIPQPAVHETGADFSSTPMRSCEPSGCPIPAVRYRCVN